MSEVRWVDVVLADLAAADIRRRVGERIKAQMEAAEWSFGVLAELAGISKGHLHQIVHGKSLPSIFITLQIAAALDCTVEELLGPEIIDGAQRKTKERRRKRAAEALRLAGVRPEDLS